MKLLFLMQGEKLEDHPGFHDAFLRLRNEEMLSAYEVIPYYGYAKKYGWKAFYHEVVRKAAEMEADAVFFHCFHGPIPSPEDCIIRLKQMNPAPVVVTSVGDPFSYLSFDKNYYPESFRITARMADLVFSTMMGHCAQKMKSWGAKNIVLMPNGICQARFAPVQSSTSTEYDVLFMGSNQQVKDPRHFMLGRQCRYRKRLVSILYDVYGKKFGLFGRGWNGKYNDHGVFPFDQQLQYACKGRVLFGGYPGSREDYYESNRIFMQGAAPVGMVDWYVPRLDKIFRDGDHVEFCRNKTEMVKKIDQLLELSPNELIERGERRSKFIFSRHTQYHRMKLAVEVLKEMCSARREGRRAQKPKLDFFLPEVDLDNELKYAICNWEG